MTDNIKQERVLLEYKSVKEKYKKTTICYYHWRGSCVFSRKRCKYAHDIVDLKRYPREQFLAIRKSFFMLKGEVHGEPNPEGTDPSPKESKIEDLAFSSDEEDLNALRAKGKNKMKEDNDKIKKAKQYRLAEFILLLLKESELPYIRRDVAESLFSDAKLKYDGRLLTEKLRVVYQKAAILAPCTQERFQVILLYPTLEQIIHPLAEYIGLSLIHICRCRRIERCRSRWSPYH
eukprot:TRINITY_DN4046_c0_g3_i4.p1 TRINITY_DN4046_c0_g3~~TRINITY_DN4046_c0_g3_i4.p1  ORF type:complete len:258 (-),score=60.26 TRINITY_DN4046_c0_g3_i4:26-724(-)